VPASPHRACIIVPAMIFYSLGRFRDGLGMHPALVRPAAAAAAS